MSFPVETFWSFWGCHDLTESDDELLDYSFKSTTIHSWSPYIVSLSQQTKRDPGFPGGFREDHCHAVLCCKSCPWVSGIKSSGPFYPRIHHWLDDGSPWKWLYVETSTVSFEWSTLIYLWGIIVAMNISFSSYRELLTGKVWFVYQGIVNIWFKGVLWRLCWKQCNQLILSHSSGIMKQISW